MASVLVPQFSIRHSYQSSLLLFFFAVDIDDKFKLLFLQRAFVVQCVFVSYGKRVFPRKLVEHRLIIVKIIVVAFAKPDFRFQKFQNEIFCVFDAAVEVNAAKKGGKLKTVMYVVAGFFSLVIVSASRCGLVELWNLPVEVLRYVGYGIYAFCALLSYISFIDYLISFKSVLKAVAE